VINASKYIIRERYADTAGREFKFTVGVSVAQLFGSPTAYFASRPESRPLHLWMPAGDNTPVRVLLLMPYFARALARLLKPVYVLDAATGLLSLSPQGAATLRKSSLLTDELGQRWVRDLSEVAGQAVRSGSRPWSLPKGTSYGGAIHLAVAFVNAGVGFLSAAQAAATASGGVLPRAVKTSVSFEKSRSQQLSIPPHESYLMARPEFLWALDDVAEEDAKKNISPFAQEDEQLEEDRAEACLLGAAAAAAAAAAPAAAVTATAAAKHANDGLGIADELGETERQSEVVTKATPHAFTDWDADES